MILYSSLQTHAIKINKADIYYKLNSRFHPDKYWRWKPNTPREILRNKVPEKAAVLINRIHSLID